MTPEQKELATLLIAGPGAAISHMTAARRHGLDVPRTALIDVSVPNDRHAAQYDDARIYRSRDLGPTEVEPAGIFLVTTVARTVIDLAPILNGHWLSTLLYSAIRENPANSNFIWLALLSHGPGRKGAHRLRELLIRKSGEFGIPRSAAESFFRHLVRATGFTPTAQYKLGQRQTVDFVFAEHATVIEIDSWSHHSSFFAYRTDRRRDIQAIRKGWVTLRCTWHDIVEDQKRVLEEVLAVLEQRSPQGKLFEDSTTRPR
jgi:very-short-patch-repair endonuclease